MGFPVSISKWNLLQNFKRMGDSVSGAEMRPVVREGYQREKPLASECAGHDEHKFQKSQILFRPRQGIATVCVCARWMAEGWSGSRWCLGLDGQPSDAAAFSRLEKECARNGRNVEPHRGSAAALPGPASSPPTSATGLLRSPEQGTYLFPVSFPASRGFHGAGSGRNSAEAGAVM